MKAFLSPVVALAFAATVAGTAVAHSGGTDENNCHTNHDTGVYHCH
jgi:hypothetical protein